MTLEMGQDVARRAAEAAARISYGKLIAILTARYHDIAAAEDALADAFATAMATWPVRGVPDNPPAWLLTVAQRGMSNHLRHLRVRDASVPDLAVVESAQSTGSVNPWDEVDHRLKLMFVCAHPTIDSTVRTALMLQTVLGLSAQTIASAFLVAPKTMGQRLSRAKTKIRDAGLRFDLPVPDELPERLDDVLSAIYAAFGSGWDDLAGGPSHGLAEESIFLCRLLLVLMPREPEVRGLLALMLFCEARRPARRDAQGRFVPLDRQDTALWSRALIIEAETELVTAARAQQFGHFQCEAAIQSVHTQRGFTGVTNHQALRTLYDLLMARAPSIGVAVGRAAALLEAGDCASGRRALDALAPEDVADYQPYWVTRARLAELEHDAALGHGYLERALGLTEDPSVRAFLAEKLSALRRPL